MMSPQRPIHLPPSDQAILAAWAAVTAMTVEFLGWPLPDNDQTEFMQDERVMLRRTLKPLPGIWPSYTSLHSTSFTSAFKWPSIVRRILVSLAMVRL
jgi:hypothetical protein